MAKVVGATNTRKHLPQQCTQITLLGSCLKTGRGEAYILCTPFVRVHAASSGGAAVSFESVLEHARGERLGGSICRISQLEETGTTARAASKLAVRGCEELLTGCLSYSHVPVAFRWRRNHRRTGSTHTCACGCAVGWASAPGATVWFCRCLGVLLMAAHHPVVKVAEPKTVAVASTPCHAVGSKRTPAGFATCYPAQNERPKQSHGNLPARLVGCASCCQSCAQRPHASDV